MNVKERLKMFIDYEGIPISSFEKGINVTNGYVNSIHKSIGIDKVNLILEKYPKLNLAWLFTGKGLMINKEVDFVNESSEVYNVKSDINTDSERILFLEEKVNFYKNQVDFYKNTVKIEDRVKDIEEFIEVLRFKIEVDNEIEKTELAIIERDKNKKQLVTKK